MTISHARAEQLRCAEYLAAFPDDPGARLGLHDWLAEEYLMENDMTDDNPMTLPGPDHPAYQPEPRRERLAIALTGKEAMEMVASEITVDMVVFDWLWSTLRRRGFSPSRWSVASAEVGTDGLVIQLEGPNDD